MEQSITTNFLYPVDIHWIKQNTILSFMNNYLLSQGTVKPLGK